MLKDSLHSTPIALFTAVICLLPVVPAARGQGNQNFPLIDRDFQQAAPRGFGDRNNSWAQGMIWWHNNLYVGTSRDSLCASLAGVYEAAVGIVGVTLANQYLPYPPNDPNLSCTPDPADLPLAAQIWRWSSPNTWTQVYNSPTTLPNPGTGPPAPPRTGKFLPYEVAFRGFAAYTESDGTEALYAFGVNSTLLWYRNELPPPRILRTTDGVNWTPLPQDPNTFLYDLPFNADHSTYRSPAIYNGMMFVLCGPINGQGSLIASANPSQGDNAWFLAAPANMLFYELSVFNGWLYIGGYNPSGGGYQVFKTNAQGPPPYQLIQVVPPGAGLTNMPSPSVVSMFVHNGRLYVGTATFPEIIRINTDDTWDLIMGAPRVDPDTGQTKYPTSNLGPGFGLTLNDHVWYQDDAYNYLYAGTYNASTGSHTDPVFGPILQPTMGGQLFITPDDWHWSSLTTNGFTSPSDPFGGMWDYGFRTIVNTPYGMFLGTANDYYGLTIFRATKSSAPPVQSPSLLEIEPGFNGGSVLSWGGQAGAKSYQVWRAALLPVLVRDNINFEGWNGATGTKIPDVYVAPYQLIGTTGDVTLLDSTVQPGSRYMYYVVGINSRGQSSTASNLTTFPLLLPSVTFAQLLSEVDTLAARHRFDKHDPRGAGLRQQVLDAEALAAACNIKKAVNTLNPTKATQAVLAPDSGDVAVLFNKLIGRLQLYSQYPTQVISNEFCSGATP